MKDFVTKILSELSSNDNLKSNSLIQMVIESTNKSIVLGESNVKIYNDLKESINNVKKHINDPVLDVILEQFSKVEDTADSRLVKIESLGNLSESLELIKNSTAYSNPIIAAQVNSFESSIKRTPEFLVYPSYIKEMSKYTHEKLVKESVNHISKVVEENRSKFEMLYNIKAMEQFNSPLYAGVVNGLKEMLAENAYSSDSIKMKYGSAGLPLINTLVDNLRLIESSENGNFYLGEGDSFTKITNIIAPAVQLEEGLLIYMDNQFMTIKESKNLSGNEETVHLNEDYTIATVSPNWVRENHSTFYSVCEAYAMLGFKTSEFSNGVESTKLPKMKIGFGINENRELDLFINGNKVEDPSSINLTQSLVMESAQTKSYITTIFENLSSIYNFEFMKEIINERTNKEAFVFELNGNYIVCDKENAATRNWKKVDEYEMYQLFLENFQYDISKIFKVKIEESVDLIKQVELRKDEISKNITSLELVIEKLSVTLQRKDLDPAGVSKLENIKESVEKTISGLKESYIKLDLSKKKVS